MSATTADRRTGPSLGTRIFLLMAAVLGLSILVSVIVTSIGADRIARRAVDRTLAGSQNVQTLFQQQRREHLRIMARSLALDPYVTAYAAEAEGTVYASSILHLLEQRRQDFGFGFAIVLDPRGRVLARTDRTGREAEELQQTPLVAAALRGGEAFGIWREGDALFDAVAVPLARETSLFGYFIVGFPIDDRQALEVKRISGTDVAYVAPGPEQPTIVASTLDANTQASLIAAIRRAAAKGEPAAGDASRTLEFDLDGRAWIAIVRGLETASETPLGMIVALAPLDAELHAFRQIETLLVGAGIVVLLLALGLSYWLSRRTLRPVRELAQAAAAARRGDYDQRVRVAGGDEVGELARTFNTLLADLREKRDMEHYMNDLSRSLSVPSLETRPGTDGASRRDGVSAGRDAETTIGIDATRAEPTSGEPKRRPQGESDPRPTPPAPKPGPPTPAGLPKLRPGIVLANRWEILSSLGQGGMGLVVQARDRDLEEIIALKVLRPEIANDRDMLERLKSELKLARRITHPNVVRTFDFLELDGIPCISMEYVHGVTLFALLERSGRLPYSAGLHLARQLGAGLAAAHFQGVIHRDIKPANLILEPNGNAKLMDFGIARPVQQVGPSRTEVGSVVGTPHYLAPEQLTGGVVDTRADIYATGVLLYEVFTGHRPYTGRTAYEIFAQHLREAPTPPRTYWAEMPPELERVLLRCLERSPENRFASIRDLLAAMEHLRGEPSVTPHA